MFNRILACGVVVGGCVLAASLLLQRYTAPACSAKVTIQQLVPQVDAEGRLSGVDLLNPKSIGGGIFARTRRCVVDVAQIEALQPVSAEHWLKVLYSTTIDRPTGTVTVRSRLAGPATPVFKTSPAA